MTDEPQAERKIIIDEDWKSQVEAEREQLRHQQDVQQPAASPGAEAADRYQLPPASFSLLVSTIATQALTALGQLPDPIENRLVVRLDVARLHIDTLSVLEEKTKGNLTADEAAMLEDAAHQLRLAFIEIRNHVMQQVAAARQTGSTGQP